MIQDPKTSAASRLTEQSKTSCDRENTSCALQSEDDSGNENKQKNVPQKRRKRAQTTPRSSKSQNPKADRSSGSRAGSSRDKQEDGEAVTLFEVINMGRNAMKAVIDDWIEAYEKERDPSVLDLFNFFIQCCGCKGVVTAEMCHSRDGSNVKSKMTEKQDEALGLHVKRVLAFPWILTVTWPLHGDVEYPLVQSGPSGRWFHSELCDFMSVLVAQFQHNVLFDSYLMNSLLALLSALSASSVRAFRHTCTLAAVKLLSSLVRVALTLSVGIENSRKMCAVQKSKTRQKNSPQIKGLQKKILELEEKRSEVESMMNVIFRGVFLKRYCDVLPEIRSICMEELGAWMKNYNTLFLNDGYLKYMGWMMHDKSSEVRLKCVLGLQEIYGDPMLFPKLRLFTVRFKDRFVSMTLDKDNEVALQSMKLLVIISNKSKGVLSPSEYTQLFLFVYSSQRPLAVVAGELLFLRLLNTSSDLQDGTNAEEGHRQQVLIKLKALLDFYQKSKLHQHVVYLVDSLWDCCSALLKDWPTITSILLQELPSCSGLKDTEVTVVVEILVASVRQAAEGPGLVGRSGGRRVASVKEKKTQVEDGTKLTEYFLEVLPKLIKKFLQREDVVALLVKIPQFFLPDYPLAEKDQLLSELLLAMRAASELHCAADILEGAARSYLSLCEDETSWCSIAQTARDAMLQTWVNQLRLLIEDSVKEGTFSSDVGKTEEILVSIKRVRFFFNCHDLSKWSLFEHLFPLMSVHQTGLPSQVLWEVLQCLCYAMLWSLNASSETLTSKEKALAQRLHLRRFCEGSVQCLCHSDDKVRQQAFLGICDVLTAHSYQTNIWDPTCCGPLLYTPSPKLQRALLTFLCSHIFVTPETHSQRTDADDADDSEVEKLEDLHKRRNLLAAFCKLIVHGILEMSLAAEVFMCYVKYYNDFGDIIKETLCRTRQMDKMASTQTLVLSLHQLFVRLKYEQESGGQPHPGVQTFTSIKELARRFAMTFGDLVKFRECVVMIHRSGIDFVFQGFKQTPDTQTPAHLSYLTILSEFSSKLLKPDKKIMLGYLQKHTAEHITNLREECWQPLGQYRMSLLAAAEAEDVLSHTSSDKKPRPSCTRSKLEGKKSTCAATPTDMTEITGHTSQRPRFSPSTPVANMDPFFVSVAPAVRRLHFDTPVLSTNQDAQEETVDVEL